MPDSGGDLAGEPIELDEIYEFGEVVLDEGADRLVMATDRSLGHRVIVRELLDGGSGDGGTSEERGAQLAQEARLLATLAHPGVVPVHLYGRRKDGRHAYAMRHVDGEQLDVFIAACRDEPEHEGRLAHVYGLRARLRLFVDLCDVVSNAHQHDVLHCDLRPEHVTVVERRYVYITGWRAIADARPSGYTAPELLGERPGSPSRASDQFALGVILRDLITLQVGGTGTSAAHLTRVPPGLRSIVNRACATVANYRYESVEALADDVRRFVHGESLEVRPHSAPTRFARWIAAHPSALVLAMVVPLLLGGLGVVRGQRREIEARDAALQTARDYAALSAYLGEVARDLDARSQEVQILLETLAADAEGRLRVIDHDAPPEATALAAVKDRAPVFGWYGGAAFDGDDPPSSSLKSKRYGRRVSYLEGSYWLADDGDVTGATQDFAALESLDDRMREMAVRSIDPRFRSSTHRFQADFLRQETSPIQFIYVGLESGLLLNFPGIGGFTADYDPRERPWYRRMASLDKASAGEPYADVAGTGVLLPFNVALRDRRDRVIGVVGTDVRLSDFARALDMSVDQQIRVSRRSRAALPGFVDAALVDATGHVVVASSDSGEAAGGTQGNATLERPVYGSPELVDAMLRRVSSSGVFEVDGQLLAYQRLSTLPWALVVRVDLGAYRAAREARVEG